MHVVTNANAVWTAAGSVYTIEEVAATFDQQISPQIANQLKLVFNTPDLNALRNDVRQADSKDHAGRLQFHLAGFHARSKHATFPSILPRHSCCLAQATNHKYFLEIDADGQLNWHMNDRFYAVGSGGAFATVAMALDGSLF